MKASRIVSFLAMGIWWVSLPAFSKNSAFTDRDRKILSELSKASQEEVSLGNLAVKKATDSEVKAFGEQMVRDHTHLLSETQKLASRENIPLLPAFSKQDEAMKISLSRRSGKDFDRHYIQGMLEDHKKDIQELQSYAETTVNPEMRDLAKRALPILENHIRTAENVAGHIGVSADKGLMSSGAPPS
ncbi:unnamed protein product [Sphagnum tenellum]